MSDTVWLALVKQDSKALSAQLLIDVFQFSVFIAFFITTRMTTTMD